MTAVAASGTGRDPVKYLLIATISLFWGLNWPAVKTILTQVPIFSLRAIGFTSFADVQAHMSQNGGTTAIDLGQGDFIVINGVAANAFSTSDFILV